VLGLVEQAPPAPGGDGLVLREKRRPPPCQNRRRVGAVSYSIDICYICYPAGGTAAYQGVDVRRKKRAAFSHMSFWIVRSPSDWRHAITVSA